MTESYVVTGGGRGIGRAVVGLLVRGGPLGRVGRPEEVADAVAPPQKRPEPTVERPVGQTYREVTQLWRTIFGT